MATPRTQSVGGWVVLCARSLGGDVGGSHSRPRSREEQGRARLDGRWPAFAGERETLVCIRKAAGWQHCQDSWDQLDDVPAAVRVSESCSTYAPGHPMKTERDVGLY